MRRPMLIAMAIVAGCLGAAAPSSASDADACTRYAATPQRVFHGDDFEFVHAAASAMYCPDDVYVQITACVELQAETGWQDVGCVTSPGTYVTAHTRGGRGQAVSFDVPCVTGVLRTHVTGGEGLEPTEWDSEPQVVACVGSGPLDGTPPETTILSGPPIFTFASSEAGSSFQCRLDDSAWEACQSPTAYPALADGPHTFAVRATDAAGNTDPTPATWAFTVAAPEPPAPPPPPMPVAASRPPDTLAPAIVVPRAHRRVRVTRRGVVALALGPFSETAAGLVVLRAAGRTLGRRSFTIAAGEAIVVRVQLRPRARARLARRHRMRARADVVLRDAAGNASAAAYWFTLLAFRSSRQS